MVWGYVFVGFFSKFGVEGVIWSCGNFLRVLKLVNVGRVRDLDYRSLLGFFLL